MARILYFDLEVDQSKKQLQRIGYILGGEEKANASEPELREAMLRADVWCGHNVLRHDLPFLRRQGHFMGLPEKPVLDTLYWSPILLPHLKSHRLDKEYLHFWGQNEPLEDARNARELLQEGLDIFRDFDPAARQALAFLLEDVEGFAPFFEEVAEPSPGENFRFLLRKWLPDALCHFQLTDADFVHRRTELAYVLGMVHAGKNIIRDTSWLNKAFPKVAPLFGRLRHTACDRMDCSYCTGNLDPEKGLQRFFGFSSFRKFEGDTDKALQQQVVEAALDQRSLLAIFPTGGGKSLAFQLPALMRGQRSGSLTVVISPLVSLMNDQIENLKGKFIVQGVALNSSLNVLERREVIRRIEDGRALIFYLSPESLRSSTTERLLLDREIDRIVIDEAHCFSTWGQDFRPDYLYIGKFIQRIQEKRASRKPIPVSCFTATARQEVIDDIKAYFEAFLADPMEEYITLQQRTNLSFRAIEVNGDDAKMEELLGLLREKEVPSIVYVARRKRAEEVSGKLRQHGFSAAHYHGGMEREVRKQMQEDFKEDRVRVMVATSAFGMGVDKDNVELVVHYNISNSLENYVQEAGRAGRDPKLEAECVILFKKDDLDKHFDLLTRTQLSQSEVKGMWQGIKSFKRKRIYKTDKELARAARWGGVKATDDVSIKVRTSINVLEEVSFVERHNNSARVFATSKKQRHAEAARKILREHSHLFKSREQDLAYRMIQRLYSPGSQNVDDLANFLEAPLNSILHIIKLFQKIGILANENDVVIEMALFPQNKRYYKKLFEPFQDLEAQLLAQIGRDDQKRRRIDLRQLNDLLGKQGVDSSLERLRKLLTYWNERRLVSIRQLPQDRLQFTVTFLRPLAELRSGTEARLKYSAAILEYLAGQHKSRSASGGISRMECSLVEIQTEVARSLGDGGKEFSLYACELCLLFLHHLGVITIQEGYLVFYNRLAIERKEADNRKFYTKENHRPLTEFYERKKQQIHIVGEYVAKLLRDDFLAATYVKDYFSLPNDAFIQKYFPRRNQKKVLKRSLTEERYQLLTKELSREQHKAFDETGANKVIIAAGPGSGKTRTLVRKMASLLLLEGVKPNQFLMLTFSRPAANEFRDRLRMLAPGIADQIDIHTFHGFAFRLLGQLGDLERADSIIEQATEAIGEETVPLDEISSKTVLVLDEVQDISEKEFQLIKAIEHAAEGIKIIAAGDDDQNIYEFRGSSTKYMHRMAEERTSVLIFLSTNYRSKYNLIDFCNQFARKLGGKRLKSKRQLKPSEKNRRSVGDLYVCRYQEGYIMPRFVDRVANVLRQEQKENPTAAILTASNQEAATICHALRQKGIPAMLIQGNEGFQLKNLRELRFFTDRVIDKGDPDTGVIGEVDWEAGRAALEQHFRSSPNLEFVERAIQDFAVHHPVRTRLGWLNFLRELRQEDFFFPEKDPIVVSTMHKSKGKEFDLVFLYLKDYKMTLEEEKRPVYVAITRAKRRLEIHTNAGIFDHFKAENLRHQNWSGAKEDLKEITIPCSLRDVNLGDFKHERTYHRLSKMRIGTELDWQYDREGRLYIKSENGAVGRFSRKFLKTIREMRSRGYELVHLIAQYHVWWWCEEDEAEYLVLVPHATFQRQ